MRSKSTSPTGRELQIPVRWRGGRDTFGVHGDIMENQKRLGTELLGRPCVLAQEVESASAKGASLHPGGEEIASEMLSLKIHTVGYLRYMLLQ